MTQASSSRYWPPWLAQFVSWRLALLTVVCSVLFFTLAFDVRRHGPFFRLDQRITDHLHGLGTQKIFFFAWVTDFGAGMARKLLWLFIIPLGFSKRWYHLPGFLLATILGGEINGRMQNFFGRHRPVFADIEKLTHPGFPSGHTANACFFFGYATLILWLEYGHTKSFKATVTAIGLLFILAVGASRAALLVHYTGDVVGSFLWCPPWIIFCYCVNRAALRASAGRMNLWLAK